MCHFIYHSDFKVKWVWRFVAGEKDVFVYWYDGFVIVEIGYNSTLRGRLVWCIGIKEKGKENSNNLIISNNSLIPEKVGRFLIGRIKIGFERGDSLNKIKVVKIKMGEKYDF